MAAMTGKLFILSFILINSVVKCDYAPKSSLVFVIDNTGSMASEIDAVKRHVNSIFDTVVNTKSSQIENFVLATFNDPSVGPVTVTNDKATFKRALNNIEVFGGGDCPEFALSGISSALARSLPRSYVFVFTDADAKDAYKYRQVKSLAQEYLSKLIFVLTGSCSGEDSGVYHRLAKDTSGHVFDLQTKTNIDEILEFVAETSKGRNTELAKADFPPGPDNKLFYAVDDYTRTVLITVLGVWPSIDVTDPDGRIPDTKKIVNKPEVAVVKVTGNKTGIYTATIGSKSKTNVVVTARTTIDFQHGFSISKPTTLKGTSIKPEPDVKSYLSISVSVLEGGEIKLTEVKLLDLSNNVLLRLPLQVTKHDKQFYVTAPFETPKQSFRIMISGYAVADNAHIERMAPTPIEPKSTAPRIVLDDNKTKYSALVGDIVLRIPCNAIGYPKPTITWKVGGKAITSGSKYHIVENALVIKSPKHSDTATYTCKAHNDIREDSKDFQGIVEDEITEYDDPHDVYILNGTSKRINCLIPRTDSDHIKWFLNGVVLNISEPFINLEEADVSKDGNYSCRVSNEEGNTMETYVVDVGFPPTFKSYQDDTHVDWDGEGTLDCLSSAKPVAKTEWYYGETPLDPNNDEQQLSISGWGRYTCKATNVHGSVQRSFDVTSSACLIHKKAALHENNPILLTENLKWPQYHTKNDHLIIPHEEKVIFSCQSQDMSQNSFKMWPNKTEVNAECAGRDTFMIDGKIYKYSALQCNHEVTPFINKTGEQCLNKDTEMIQVGYKVHEFVEVYRVCLDTANQVPLYSVLRNININTIIPEAPTWHTVSHLGSGNNEYDTCKKLPHTCCTAKEQLVSGKDVALGAPQRSTFYNQLNSILVWQPCDDSRITWSVLGASIKQQALDTDALEIWSGASEYSNAGERKIAQYLWKVIKYDESESMALIYVNDPSPKDSQVLCKNVCAPGQGSWFESKDKYTYCCELKDFITAFNIPEDIFKTF